MAPTRESAICQEVVRVVQSQAQFGPGAPGHRRVRQSHRSGDWCGGVSVPDPGWCGGGEPPRPWCDSTRAPDAVPASPVPANPVPASPVPASTGLVVLGALAGLARALGRGLGPKSAS